MVFFSDLLPVCCPDRRGYVDAVVPLGPLGVGAVAAAGAGLKKILFPSKYFFKKN